MTRNTKQPITVMPVPEDIRDYPNIRPQQGENTNPWTYSNKEAYFGLPGFLKQKEIKAPTSAFEIISANFQRENNLGSEISDIFTLMSLPDDETSMVTPPDFDPLAEIQGYEEYKDTFASATTPLDVEFLKRKIDKERKNKQIQEEGGWLNFVSGLAAGVLDPINLVPVGGAANVTYKIGESFLKGAVATGRAGLLGSSVSELALHSSQETRTFGESAANIAGGTLLAGVLGGSIGAYNASKRRGAAFNELADKLEKDMIVPKAGEDYLGGDPIVISKADLEHDLNIYKSVGAAAPNKTEAKLKSMFGAEKFAMNPGLRLATSEFLEARRLNQKLIDLGLQFEDNAAGIETPFAASTIINHLQKTSEVQVYNIVKDTFTAYKERVGKLPANERPVVYDEYGIAATSNYLSKEEFNAEISKALRRSGKHNIQEVKEAAGQLRTIMNKFLDMAIDEGVLSEKYRKADTNYLHRIYDIDKITAKREDFKRLVTDWLRGDAELALDDVELGECANQIIAHITGESRERLQYNPIMLTSNKRGPLAERVFNIPDRLIENYLINDIELVMNRYVNTMSADITLHKLNIEDSLKKIDDECTTKISQIKIEDPDLPKRRTALLQDVETRYSKDIEAAKTSAAKKAIEDAYIKERTFVEQATPDEVLSRRNNIQVLDHRFEKEQKSFYERLWKREEIQIQKEYQKKIDILIGKQKEQDLKKAKTKSQIDKIEANYKNEKFLAKIEKQPRVVKLKDALNKKLESFAAAREKGKLPKLSDKMKARQEKMLSDYKTSREAILNAKPRAMAEGEKINASREAELKSLSLSDPNNATKVREINQKYDDLLNRVGMKEKDGLKRIRSLEKKRDRDKQDILAIVNILKGQSYKNSSSLLDAPGSRKTLETIKTWNAARLLGMSTLSAIPDLGSFIMVHGFTRTIGDLVLPFIGNLGKIFKGRILGVKEGAYFESRQELRDLMGFGNEFINNSRAESLAGLNNKYAIAGIEKFNRKVSRYASYFSGITYWQSLMTTAAADMARAKILRLSTQPSLTKKEIESLAAYGINKDFLLRINNQYKKFGHKADGKFISNIDKWDDIAAADVLQLAIRKIADNTILTPASYERPLLFSSPIGSLFGQFRSFGFAAYQRYFLAGLQRRDFNFISGAFSMVALGILSQSLKELLSKGAVKERTAEEWISIGFKKSGVLGHLMDLEDITDKISGGTIGIDSLLGVDKGKVYGPELNVLQSLSPTLGLASDIGTATSGTLGPLLGDRRYNGRTLSATRRLVILQNAIGIRKGFDAVEDYLRDQFGLRAR